MSSTELNQFFEIAVAYVLDRFKTFGRSPAASVKSSSADLLNRGINNRSEILLYGPEVTLRLQFFFSVESAAHPLAHLYEKVSDDNVKDFFNELCNLSLGQMKVVLGAQGLKVALSLPATVTTSASRVLDAKEVLEHVFYFDVLVEGSTVFQGKLSCEVHKVEAVEKLRSCSVPTASAAEDEIEFF